jgi:hypothetical protein
MTSTQRHFAGLAVAGGLAFLSWLTISPGTPQIYAPLNLFVVIPEFLTSSAILAVAVTPLFFYLWSWPVWRGVATLPIRSIVLLVLCIVLSAANFAFGFRFASEYHGAGYVVGVLVVNLCCWPLLGALAVRARWRPGFGRNLAFHAALFAWLAWGAFPYLGELP